LLSAAVYAQETPYKHIVYSFINQNADSLHFFGNAQNDFNNVCKNLNQLILKGKGQIRVLHIGDSHIQADFFSGRLRENLQRFALGIQGSRGFIFPYNVAATNNPDNYKVKYTGKWQHCRNIQNLNGCELGIAGISVTTTDSNASIQIILNNRNYPFQDFNKVKIFHNTGDTVFKVKLMEDKIINGEYNSLGYTSFTSDAHFDTLNLFFQKTDSLQKNFALYGIELDNDDPGIICSAVGVNGAEVSSFLKCSLLEAQLKILNPEWIIVSLGTNDAYGKNFDPVVFENHYQQLIQRIKHALPHSFILLTTPADSYRKKRYPNPDMMLAKRAILNIAGQNECAVWDLYQIMGGFMSMKKWQKLGLAANDRIHFSKAGYELQGDLLFNAFLKAYDRFIEKSW
jgi:lysophospholipase L1-like esterase